LLPPIAAPIGVIGDRIGEGGLQLVERPPLKGQHISRVDDFAVKKSGRFVQLHIRHVAVMGHRRHGVTPASRKNRRTDRTAPRSVSRRGCGR
jgi:hypothetical protein